MVSYSIFLGTNHEACQARRVFRDWCEPASAAHDRMGVTTTCSAHVRVGMWVKNKVGVISTGDFAPPLKQMAAHGLIFFCGRKKDVNLIITEFWE